MNPTSFKKRLATFYTHWSKHKQDVWGGSDVLLVSTPPPASHPISTSFFLWLLGYHFAHTIAIFTLKEIHFICATPQSASQLTTLAISAKEAVGAQLIVHAKPKGDNADMIMDEILSCCRVRFVLRYLSFRVPVRETGDKHNIGNNRGPLFIVGHVDGESPTSELLWGSSTKRKRNEFQTVDINNGLSKFGCAHNGAPLRNFNIPVADSSQGEEDLDCFPRFVFVRGHSEYLARFK